MSPMGGGGGGILCPRFSNFPAGKNNNATYLYSLLSTVGTELNKGVGGEGGPYLFPEFQAPEFDIYTELYV